MKRRHLGSKFDAGFLSIEIFGQSEGQTSFSHFQSACLEHATLLFVQSAKESSGTRAPKRVERFLRINKTWINLDYYCAEGLDFLSSGISNAQNPIRHIHISEVSAIRHS
ncbi:hypothetical protein XH98_17100 [Bradyrhizobium sp. CCBAU 51745]|nr:hypothetical protein [Bradyrhizobium sp. CCBAU 51745]